MNNSKNERTFVIIKPDAVQRSLIGEIIKRLERTGLKLVATKMIKADKDKLLTHYGKNDEWYLAKGTSRKRFLTEAGASIDQNRAEIEFGKDIINDIVRFMQSSPVVAMVWEGNQAVNVVKKLVGGTDPTVSDVGTIRGDFQIDSYFSADSEQRGLRNLLHCSDKVEEALREISIWFSPEEIQTYRHINEAVLSDVNLDGTKE